MENEIVLYQPNESIKLNVRVEGETVWLTQQQMSLCLCPQKVDSNCLNCLKNLMQIFALQGDFLSAEYGVYRKSWMTK